MQITTEKLSDDLLTPFVKQVFTSDASGLINFIFILFFCFYKLLTYSNYSNNNQEYQPSNR